MTAEAAADMEAGMSVVDCITAFGNYIPGATNLMDVCTPECEIILDSGFPVNMGEFKEKAGPTMLQEIEKNSGSADAASHGLPSGAATSSQMSSSRSLPWGARRTRDTRCARCTEGSGSRRTTRGVNR